MNTHRLVASLFVLAMITASGAGLAETTFTYQGRLGNAGAPADGSHDFEFRLFDAETGGAQIGGDLPRDTVDVTDGVFTVQLDFGDAPFNSAPRWLEIDVRESGGGTYTTLAPRNRIGASPFAVQTLHVAPGAVDTAAIQDGAVTRQKLANNAVDTAVIADQTVTTNDIRDNNITAEKFAEGAVDSRAIDVHAVTGAAIAPDSIESSHVVDGSLTVDDLTLPTLYISKEQLVRREFSLGLIGDARTRISASCDGPTDLPIGGSCDVDEDLLTWIRVQSTRYDHWTDATVPALVECEFYNAGSEISTVRAVIHCLPTK